MLYNFYWWEESHTVGQFQSRQLEGRKIVIKTLHFWCLTADLIPASTLLHPFVSRLWASQQENGLAPSLGSGGKFKLCQPSHCLPWPYLQTHCKPKLLAPSFAQAILECLEWMLSPEILIMWIIKLSYLLGACVSSALTAELLLRGGGGLQVNWVLLCWCSEDYYEHVVNKCVAERDLKLCIHYSALPPMAMHLVGMVVGKRSPHSWQHLVFPSTFGLLWVCYSSVEVCSLVLNIQSAYSVLFGYYSPNLNLYTLSVKTPHADWLCTIHMHSPVVPPPKWGFICSIENE